MWEIFVSVGERDWRRDWTNEEKNETSKSDWSVYNSCAILFSFTAAARNLSQRLIHRAAASRCHNKLIELAIPPGRVQRRLGSAFLLSFFRGEKKSSPLSAITMMIVASMMALCFLLPSFFFPLLSHFLKIHVPLAFAMRRCVVWHAMCVLSALFVDVAMLLRSQLSFVALSHRVCTPPTRL